MKIEDIEKANSLKEKIAECETALDQLKDIAVDYMLEEICKFVKDDHVIFLIYDTAVEGLKAKIEKCKEEIEEL